LRAEGGTTIIRVLRSLRIENLVLIREADLGFHPGLNAITGETGAGKTILAQAIGLLLGAKADSALVGPEAPEAYVEAELDVPGEMEEVEALAEQRPEGEDGLVLARRVSTEGRSRAFAWGRGAATADVASAAEVLIAMSGQFEQRRLSRPAYQLEVLDGFLGEEQLRWRADGRAAWRVLQEARKRHEELTRDAAALQARISELRALAEDTESLEPETEDELNRERERLRHGAELAEGVAAAVEALAPEEGEGAAGLAAQAERSLAPVERLAPELERAAAALRDLELRLRDTAGELRSFLHSLDAEPDRLEQVEADLQKIADARRRFRCDSYAELLDRAAEARAELAKLDEGIDPAAEAAAAVAEAERRYDKLASGLKKARAGGAHAFAEAVAKELHGIGMGEGEFRAELEEAEPGPTGADRVSFLIRPNAGLPFAPVAETASGGELSRIALAIAAAGGGHTLIFDEIDAGIGGQTAHAVAETLKRLAERAQVVTITHLPQIASVADSHFRVEKVPGDPTHTRIEQLDDEERKAELERMLGGREFLTTLG
jgi:DNA repair protein RecN (Recombination protein N)